MVREYLKKKQDDSFCLLVGFDDHFIYEELARELHERRVGVTQLLKDESKAFSMWQEAQNKIHY
jgi:hypothetical protein